MDRVRRTVGCDRLDTSQYNGRGVYVVVLDSGVQIIRILMEELWNFGILYMRENTERIRIMMIMDTAHMCEVP